MVFHSPLPSDGHLISRLSHATSQYVSCEAVIFLKTHFLKKEASQIKNAYKLFITAYNSCPPYNIIIGCRKLKPVRLDGLHWHKVFTKFRENRPISSEFERTCTQSAFFPKLKVERRVKNQIGACMLHIDRRASRIDGKSV
jgi:hypothetical protein